MVYLKERENQFIREGNDRLYCKIQFGIVLIRIDID